MSLLENQTCLSLHWTCCCIGETSRAESYTQTEILLWQPSTLRSKHMNPYIIYVINNYVTTNLILTSAIRILNIFVQKAGKILKQYDANVFKQYDKSLINDPQTAHQQINVYCFPAFPIHTLKSFSAVHGSKDKSHNIKRTKEYG